MTVKAEDLDAPTLFEAAALLIQQGLVQLDTRTEACGQCGHRGVTNRAHMKAFDIVNPMVEKLRVSADRLRGDSREQE